MGRHMDAKTEAEIYRLLLDEMPHRRICARLNATISQVERVARKYGVPAKNYRNVHGLRKLYGTMQKRKGTHGANFKNSMAER